MRLVVVLAATLMFYGIALLWPRFSHLPVLRTKGAPVPIVAEGLLARRLMAGEISDREYTRAMGELAERAQ